MATMPPILLNIDGTFHLRERGRAPVSGSVSGDLRLAALDAFLQTLNGTLKKDRKQREHFAVGMDQVITQLRANGAREVVIQIEQTIDPKNNQLTHTFKVGGLS